MMVFDGDEERGKGAEENGFEDFPMEIGCVKVEDVEPEFEGTEQSIAPDGHSVSNGGVFKANDYEGACKSLNDPVKHEPVDVKVEIESDDFMVVFTRDDDSFDGDLLIETEGDDSKDGHLATDSYGRIPSVEIQTRASSSRTNAEKLRQECKTRGLSYMSKSGRIIAARTVKPNCGSTCRYQCFLRVSEEVRQELLANLLEMSQSNQLKFIHDHICIMPAARPHTLDSRRTFSYHFFLPIDSRLVKVCKTMFANTYDLQNTKLKGIIAKKISDKHVVCGNPNFPALLKKNSKYTFEYDEVCDQAKAVPQQGQCKCDLQCGSMFPEELVNQIHSSFRELTKHEKTEFLCKHVQLSTNEKIHHKSKISRARFYLPLGSKVKEVCRKMFLRTFKLKTGQISFLLNNLPENSELLIEVKDPLELAKEHIAIHRMDEDHHCAASGALWKLSNCPNVARMYSEYLEGCQEEVIPIEYQQFYGEFSKAFAKTGLLLPTRCPDCGFFDRGG